MNEADTYTAFIKVVYTQVRGGLEPVEQASLDQQMYMEEPGELLGLIRRAAEDESFEVVVVHETVDDLDDEAATLREKFDADWE